MFLLEGKSTDQVAEELLDVQCDKIDDDRRSQRGHEWKVITKVQDCFPGGAKVQTRSGPKSMDNLEIGEELLVFNSNKRRTVLEGHNFSSLRSTW